jgi:hypothetical protein
MLSLDAHSGLHGMDGVEGLAQNTRTQAHAHTHALRIRGPAHHAHLALPFGEGRIVFFAVTAPFACVLSTFKPLEEQQQSQSNV